MSKKNIGETRVHPKEEFMHDPVVFGALMAFQYGTGDDFKEAESLLFREDYGISCKNIEELEIVLPNLDFWLSTNKEQQKPRRFRLYLNAQTASLYAARLLQDLGCKFEVIPTDATNLLVHGEKTPLPILVDLKTGVAKKSLREVKNFLRHFAVPDQKKRYHSRYNRYNPQIDFMNDAWYRDEEGKIQHAEVWCLDEKDKEIFKGAFSKAPYPVTEILQAHWYVQRVGLKAFHSVAVWNLGTWGSLLQKVKRNGHLIQKSPPVVLFADEIKALTDSEDRLIVDDHGCMYCVNYDAYFLIGGCLYRIYARHTD